jgi:hypothetical protein
MSCVLFAHRGLLKSLVSTPSMSRESRGAEAPLLHRIRNVGKRGGCRRDALSGRRRTGGLRSWPPGALAIWGEHPIDG